ncbi:hypothetical protein MPL1032_180050 [Mesorhizobium plurifarium]|uniref:Transposase n=1 Tax=Mesorhizobium plurifarium TaxID=69974 RepID=A0A0K2VU53_MESPL|nr:hypothetical protein MPL1032_180050 [Mesorhizobium plurifarium]
MILAMFSDRPANLTRPAAATAEVARLKAGERSTNASDRQPHVIRLGWSVHNKRELPRTFYCEWGACMRSSKNRWTVCNGRKNQKLLAGVVGRSGRRRYHPASRERLVVTYLLPGVSASRLALGHGVNANLVRKWIKKRTDIQCLAPSTSPAFIPVQIESTSDSD